MLNFIYDIKFNIIGSVYALLGVVVTSFYQVVLKHFSQQKRLQLAHYIVFVSLDDWWKAERIATKLNAATVLPGPHFGRSTHFARSDLWAHFSHRLSDLDFLRIGRIFIQLLFILFLLDFVYLQLPVVFSCLIAFTVNLSIYWIIGNTSALT